ncbi:MAG TPA: GNAT family N-acetyltransferase [Verrucomicrobiales bacterium]|nr:GNAT family N-acetyltransferase [Verrucomicrobiales bacterium]
MIDIRPATSTDRESVWEIFKSVVRAGDAFVFDPDISREEALAYWFREDHRVYVAEHENRIIGSYIFRANQPGLGSHIANASFMVSPSARGLGAGRTMGEHCLREAAAAGFRGMQFNIVVSTNEAAVHLWESLGFAIAGTLPGAFRHATLGYVDAFVMFRSLLDLR